MTIVTIDTSPPLLGAALSALDDPAPVLAWLFQQEPPPALPFLPAYALAQCTDTLAWGILAPEGGWRWNGAADLEIRLPRAGTLIDVRLFGGAGELLIWAAAGAFHGRFLQDAPAPADPSGAPVDALYPFEQGRDGPRRIDGEPESGGFVRRVTAGGRITVTPAGRGVVLRQYLQECPHTGILRVATTRFVRIEE